MSHHARFRSRSSSFLFGVFYSFLISLLALAGGLFLLSAEVFAQSPQDSPGQEKPQAAPSANSLQDTLIKDPDASRFPYSSITTNVVKIGGATEGYRAALQMGNNAVQNLSGIAGNSLNNALVIQVPQYREDNYFPGLVWATSDKNTGKPMMGIWGQMTGTGSKLYFGTQLNTLNTLGSTTTGGITNQALTIDQEGRVGIGTPTPSGSSTVQISGGDDSMALFGPNAKWSGLLWVGAGTSRFGAKTAQVIATDGNLHLDAGTNSHLYLGYYNPTDTYINPQGGNVGIGTTTPGAKLDVNGSIQTNSPIYLTGTGTGTYNRGAIYNDPTNNFLIERARKTESPSGEITDFIISQRGTGPAAGAPFIVKGSGNVGVGTIDPKYRLHVTNTSGGSNGIRIEDTVGNDPHIDFINKTGGRNYITMDVNGGQGGNSAMTFATKDAPRMTIDFNAGNVGIGTTNPIEKFQVQDGNIFGIGPVGLDERVKMRTNTAAGNYNYEWQLSSGQDDIFRIYKRPSDDDASLKTALVIDPNSNVSIAGGLNVAGGILGDNLVSAGTGKNLLPKTNTLGTNTNKTNAINCGNAGDDWSACNYSGGNYQWSTANMLSPRGFMEDVGVLINSGPSGDYRIRLTQAGTGIADVRNKTFTYSLWVKPSSDTSITLFAAYGGDAGRFITYDCSTKANVWTRCTATGTTAGTSYADNSEIRIYLALNTNVTYNVFGAQLEQSPSVTAYEQNGAILRGNVGIGTTSPQKKLHITGADDSGANAIFNNDQNDRPGIAIRGNYPEIDLISNVTGNTNHGATLRFGAYDNANKNTWKHWVVGTPGADATHLDFGYAANQSNPHFGISNYDKDWNGSNGFTVMSLNNSGNVGIGTKSPGARLEVNAGTGIGTISTPGLKISTPVQDGANQDALFLVEDGARASGKQSISWWNGNQNYYKARLWTEVGGGYNGTTFGIDTADDARNVATRFAIRNGNVGIGTTSPSAKLEINNGYLRIDSPGLGWGTNQRIVSAGPLSFQPDTDNTGDPFVYFLNPGGSPSVTVNANAGNISVAGTITSSQFCIAGGPCTKNFQTNRFVTEGNTATADPNASGGQGVDFYVPSYTAINQWGSRIWKDHHGGGISLNISTQYTDVWRHNVVFGHGRQPQDPIMGVYGGVAIGSGYAGQYLPPNDGLLVQGNVGIGTTSPGAKLDVNGNAIVSTNLNVGGNIITPNSVSAGNFVFRGTGGNSGQSYNHYGIYQEPGNWTHPYPDLMIEYHTGIKYVAYNGYGGHRFYAGYSSDASPTTEVFSTGNGDNNTRVNYNLLVNGNVGIGTSSPEEDLHIKSSRASLEIQNTNTAEWAFIRLGDRGQAGGNFWDIAQYGNNDFLEFRPNSSDNNKMVLKKNGDLVVAGAVTPSRFCLSAVCIGSWSDIRATIGNNTSYPVTAGDGNGLKFWNGSDTYKIAMGNSSEYQYGPVTDYSIKNFIDSAYNTRGFTWGQIGATPIAALNVGNGNMQIAGNFVSMGSVKAGSIGIGTVPSSRLHIHGNYSNNGEGGFLLDATDNVDPNTYALRINPFVVGSAKVGYQFQTKSAIGGTQVPLTFDNAGNVGIGTTSPSAKLDVNGKIRVKSGNGSADQIYLDRSSTASEGGMVFSDAGDIRWYMYQNDGGNDLNIQQTNVSGEGDDTPRIRLPGNSKNVLLGLSGGNVGIGTPNPQFGLDVQANAGRVGMNNLYFTGSGNAADGSPRARLIEHYGMRYDSPDSTWIFSSKNSVAIGFDTWQKTGGWGGNWGNGDLLVSGNIGVGTANPGRKLEVYGGGNDTFIHVDSDDGKKSGIEFAEQGFGGYGVHRWGIRQYYDGSNDIFHIDPVRDSVQGTGIMMDGNGRVGIGTTNPQAKLDVAGGILARSIYTNTTLAIASESTWPNNIALWVTRGAFFGGNVGIGTDAPKAKLDVDGNIKVSGNVGIGVENPVVKLQIQVPGSGNPVKGMYLGVESFGTTNNAKKSYFLKIADQGSGAAAFLIRGDGNVGIGVDPQYKLDVNGSINVAFNDKDNHFVEQSGKKLAYDSGIRGFDIAENFVTNIEVYPGDIVVTSDQDNTLTASSIPYQKGIIGVVSTAPAILFEGSEMKLATNLNFKKGKKPPVALSGRVPVRVNLEGGPIRPGDYLTTSSKRGHAMKATHSGPTVGIALESFDGSLDKELIMIFINPGDNNTQVLFDKINELEKKISEIHKR